MKEHCSISGKDVCIMIGLIAMAVLWYAVTWPVYLAIWLWKKAKGTIALVLCLIVASCLLQGCGAVCGTMARINSHEMIGQPYFPTTIEGTYLLNPNEIHGEYLSLGSAWVLYPIVLIDLPFTAVTDTVMLPVDIPLSLHNMGN